jgi:PIN domain nuclease of toxin-antitoxin system
LQSRPSPVSKWPGWRRRAASCSLGTVEQFFDEALGKAGLHLLPLTPRIAAQSVALPDIHRDPIDRVIVATAIELGAELVSKDELITKYPGVSVLWND